MSRVFLRHLPEQFRQPAKADEFGCRERDEVPDFAIVPISELLDWRFELDLAATQHHIRLDFRHAALKGLEPTLVLPFQCLEHLVIPMRSPWPTQACILARTRLIDQPSSLIHLLLPQLFLPAQIDIK
jgi:hypothetical protein